VHEYTALNISFSNRNATKKDVFSIIESFVSNDFGMFVMIGVGFFLFCASATCVSVSYRRKHLTTAAGKDDQGNNTDIV